VKLLNAILADKGLLTASFDDAFSRAISFYKDIDIEQSERIRICAALSYEKDGAVCDLGSYINAYPVVLALLGMRVVTVDYYPQTLPGDLYFKPNIRKGLAIYRSVGIEVVEADLYDVALPEAAFDVVTSFETFEHLWHSPKPIVNKVQSALKSGGSFVLSVPNVVNLASRLKMLLGRSPFEPFQVYYDHGNPFTGHRREMTMAEVHWMMTTIGLTKARLFAANLAPPCGENASAAGRVYRILTETLPVPQELRATIFAVYKKQ
jgi:SAM-dependent methyltransferase